MNAVEVKEMFVDYMAWIELFTEYTESFYDDSYLYISNDLKKIENDNAPFLSDFYKIIDKILKSEDVYPVVDNYQKYYSVSYNGTNYEIGFMEGQETVYFCRRVAPNDKLPIVFKILEKKLIKNYN